MISWAIRTKNVVPEQKTNADPLKFTTTKINATAGPAQVSITSSSVTGTSRQNIWNLGTP